MSLAIANNYEKLANTLEESAKADGIISPSNHVPKIPERGGISYKFEMGNQVRRDLEHK